MRAWRPSSRSLRVAGKGLRVGRASCRSRLDRALRCLLRSPRADPAVPASDLVPHPPPLQRAPGLSSGRRGNGGHGGGERPPAPQTPRQGRSREKKGPTVNPTIVFKSPKKCPVDTEMALLLCPRRKNYLAATSIGSPSGVRSVPGNQDWGRGPWRTLQGGHSLGHTEEVARIASPRGTGCLRQQECPLAGTEGQPGEPAASLGTLTEPECQGRCP